MKLDAMKPLKGLSALVLITELISGVKEALSTGMLGNSDFTSNGVHYDGGENTLLQLVVNGLSDGVCSEMKFGINDVVEVAPS